jgi:hypothetical protein
MALLKPEFVEAHPVKAGLAWAAAFAPMLAAVMIVTGSKPTLSWILDLIALSVSGGLLWAYVLRAHNRSRDSQ